MAKKPICLVPPRIFLVNKPRGLHSGDVLKHFKYNLPLGFGKIGHLGTLDPFAEGLLLIAIGQAARLSFLFEEILSKTYFASGVFNSSSTTGDCDGEITMSEKVKLPSSIEINNICEEFIGDYWQAPPHFSASKHNGKALYKYAREGILISKPPVKRTIYQISNFLLSGSEESCTFSAEVSSGTYIRTLFEDMAKKMGTVGHLNGLKRTSIGAVSLDLALTKEQWPVRGVSYNMISHSVCPSQFFPFKKLFGSNMLMKRVENGQRISLNDFDINNLADTSNNIELRDLKRVPEESYIWIFSDQHLLRGLMQLQSGVLAPRVIFPKINQNI